MPASSLSSRRPPDTPATGLADPGDGGCDGLKGAISRLRRRRDIVARKHLDLAVTGGYGSRTGGHRAATVLMASHGNPLRRACSRTTSSLSAMTQYTLSR